ncbi:MAG TPA: butyrate kinase [Candidatus Aminicenantes bacterium]|nr:butyrate kinase [Candidatus Aminicenantes bacterium]
MLLLIVNPGSTSTKIAVYDDEREVLSENIAHSAEELAPYAKIVDQKGFRKDIVLGALRKKGIEPRDLAAVVGRGGLLVPIPSGVYRVNERMLEDLNAGVQGEHASNLGGLIADEIAGPLGLPAFIVDPVVVDELEDWARLSGVPEIRRRSIFHALNHKYTARLAARELGRSYESVNLVVCHLGGGITVGAHERGRVVDVNNGLNGEGPITPERAGTVPAGDLVALACSGKHAEKDLKKMLTGRGGMVAHLGTNDMRETLKRAAAGDAKARLVFTAMVNTVAKQVGACAAVLKGRIDGIVLTGGLAHAKEFVDGIEERVRFLGRVFVFPGENEMIALAQAGLRVLRGEEEARAYPS